MAVVKDWICCGLRCRVLDGPFKNYNGYVAVPKGHSAWGVNYTLLPIDVHGGLTFGGEGKNDDSRWPNGELYWFGFDTSHAGDKVYYKDRSISEPSGHYWTVEEVVEETESILGL